MLIDSHQHFWQVGRFPYPWLTPELGVLYRDYLPPELEPLLSRNQVEKTVLVQASNSIEETHWFLSLADQYPFIAGVVGWVDLGNPEVERQLETLAAYKKFKGVRHLVESEPVDDWLIQPAVLRGLKALATFDLSYDLLVHTRHLKYISQVVEVCASSRFVIDHLAKPPIKNGELNEWAAAIKPLANYRNLYCKLSGLVTEADHRSWTVTDLQPYVEIALEYFGPERLMFGSDYPVCLLAASYDQVVQSAQELVAQLNPPDQAKIFRLNATEFYRLKE